MSRMALIAVRCLANYSKSRLPHRAVLHLTHSRQFLTFPRRYSDDVFGRIRSSGRGGSLLPHENISQIKRVFKHDIEVILARIENKGSSFTGDHGTTLLRCCGSLMCDETPENRSKLVAKIWDCLQTTGIGMRIEQYNALLKTYVENEHRFSQLNYLATMKNQGVTPNQDTYNYLIASSCQHGDIRSVTEMLNIMKTEGISVNESVFNSLILGHARARNLKSSFSVLDTMSSTGIHPSAQTYIALLHAHIECDTSDFLNTYKKAKALGMTFTTEQLLSLLVAAAKRDEQAIVDSVISWLDVKPLSNSVIMNTIIQLIHLKQENVAYKLLVQFPNSVQEKGDVTPFGNFFLCEMIKANLPCSSLVNISRDLFRGRNKYSFQNAAEAALATQQLSTVLQIYSVMKEENLTLRPHYFWPIFAAIHSDSEHNTLDIMQQMMNLGIIVNFETLTDYVLPKLNTDNPIFLMEKLKNMGLKVSDVLTAILHLYLERSDLSNAITLVEKYAANVNPFLLISPLVNCYYATKNIPLLVKVLEYIDNNHEARHGPTQQLPDWLGQFFIELVSQKKFLTGKDKDLICFLQELRGKGLYMSAHSQDFIVAELGNETEVVSLLENLVSSQVGLPPIPYTIPQQNDMETWELECHLRELQAKKMNTRGVLRKLFLSYCQRRNLQRVIELKQELDLINSNYSGGMLAAMFDILSQHELLDDAMQIIEQLKRDAPTFIIDDFKMIDFARQLVIANRVNEAVNFLLEHGEKGHVRASKGTVTNCWRLLNCAAEKGDAHTVKMLYEVLIGSGYCIPSNIILGPLVKVHIVNSNMKLAVEEMINCAQKHKVLPMRHEVLCNLIRKQAMEESSNHSEKESFRFIQMVYDTNVEIHGDLNGQLDILFAFVECSQVNEARKILSNMKGKIHWPRVQKMCHRWLKENKAYALIHMADACKGVTANKSGIDEIYILLLRFYGDTADKKSATELWTLLQEKNIEPPADFLKILTKITKKKTNTGD